jgi:uncharacterized membrane protein YcaP (DUF421 family)
METIRLVIGPDNGASALQLCARAILLFFFGILCIRIAGRRTFAQYSPLDIIVALIVGSSISRVMTGRADVFPTLAATLTLVVLHRVVTLATLRSDWLSRIVKAAPIVIVHDGVLDEHAMHRAGLSHRDLREALRLESTGAIDNVERATMEGGGKVSVVKRAKPERAS